MNPAGDEGAGKNPGEKRRCIIVTGPTASGKTRLAVRLARRFKGEIVSADSRQVYRGLDLGTGKDLAEYGCGEEAVRYHLINVADPGEEYHLFRYLAEARRAIDAIRCRGARPMVAGGTALYVKALLEGYALEGAGVDKALRKALADKTNEELVEILAAEAPDVLARADVTQRRRLLRAVEIARSRSEGACAAAEVVVEPVADTAVILAPYYPRRVMHARIEARLDARLKAGMIEEVRGLHREGINWDRLEWLGLEYRYVSRHLRGILSFSEMRDTLLARIRRLCRSQDIWFRKMEREGHVIHWLPEGNFAMACDLVEDYLAGHKLPDPVLRLDDVRYGPRSD